MQFLLPSLASSGFPADWNDGLTVGARPSIYSLKRPFVFSDSATMVFKRTSSYVRSSGILRILGWVAVLHFLLEKLRDYLFDLLEAHIRPSPF